MIETKEYGEKTDLSKKLFKSAFLRITMQQNDDERIYGPEFVRVLLWSLTKFKFFFPSISWKWPGQKYIFLASAITHSFSIIFLSLFVVCHERCVWSAPGLLDNNAANCDSIGRFSQLKPGWKYIRQKERRKKKGRSRFLERQTQRQGFLTQLLSDDARPRCVSVRAIESLPAINRNFRAKRKKRVVWYVLQWLP